MFPSRNAGGHVSGENVGAYVALFFLVQGMASGVVQYVEARRE